VQGGDTGATFTTSSAEWCIVVSEYSGLLAVQADLLDMAIGRFTRASAVELITSVSCGHTGMTDATSEIAVAGIAVLGSNAWSGTWTDGFTQRATAASPASGSSKAVLAVADRTLTDHAELDPGTSWTTARRSIAIVVTLRAASPATNPLQWAWVGAPTSSGAEVVAQVDSEVGCRLVVSTSAALTSPTYSATVTADEADDHVVRLPITGLAAGTVYHWGVEVDGDLAPQRGTFTTHPAAGPASFMFGFGSCGKYRTNGVGGVTWPMSFHPVWDVIESKDPLFFLHMGDFHYQDSDSTDPALHTQPMYDVLQSQKQGPMWRRVPIVYMYDDHDFCGNNTVGTTAASRNQAVATQRLLVPTYPRALSGATDALHFAFTVGRCRFLYPDRFADASTTATAETSAKTLVGLAGRAWLEAELADADADPGIALIVLVLGTMWIVDAASGWGQWSWERDYFGDIVSGLSTQVCGVAGDGHMMCYDDGSNNQWGGFPLFHAAAMDHSGVTKGGPYSSGTPIENSSTVGVDGLYGLFTVTDDGTTVTVDWSGRRVSPAGTEETLLTHQFQFDAPFEVDPGRPTYYSRAKVS
jgi:alkaline phosphatase D